MIQLIKLKENHVVETREREVRARAEREAKEAKEACRGRGFNPECCRKPQKGFRG